MSKKATSRTILNPILWCAFVILATCIFVYFITGKILIAIYVGFIEVIVKLIFYFMRKRICNKRESGRILNESFVLWFTGLSGAGKSTLADKVYDYIQNIGCKVERLDGDSVREIFPQTGFTKEERDSHIKRIGFLASILEGNGIIVVASFVSPYAEARNFVRNRCNNFIEVYAKASIEKCEQRDVKGLYKKVRSGEITQFTGIDDPYQEPENPNITVETDIQSEEESLLIIVKYLEKYINKE